MSTRASRHASDRPRRGSPWRRGALLAVVVAAGLGLRAHGVARTPLSLDEAESALNALTILERGVPVGVYAGQPLFENTLLRPWPESLEYEFRDLSYSDRGLAVYHGWMPLYAQALSFALAGVSPDPAPVADAAPRPRHDEAEQRRRTLAARAPALVFAALFILAAWLAGRAMLGHDAALAAAALAAFTPPCVRVGAQARYYSATLLLSTLCCLALWRLGQRGRRRDAALLALALVLLFHTHPVTAAGACAVAALWLPVTLGRRAVAPLALVGGLTALGAVPWLVLTGALDALPRVPAARDLLTLEDARGYLVGRPCLVALVVAAAATPLLARAPGAAARGAARVARPAGLLALWIVAVGAAFVALAPAPSFYLWRLTLGFGGPALVLAALLACGAARAAGLPRLVPALVLGALALAPTACALAAARPDDEGLRSALEHLRRADLAPGARLYATPDQHLRLTLYAGVPVQSIAPVRREFLDEHPGEVVLIDGCPPRIGVDPALIEEAAREEGRPVSPAAARAWSQTLRDRLMREDVAASAASVTPPLGPLAPHLLRAVERARAGAAPPPGADLRWQNPAMYRGYEATSRRRAWQVFAYRFVHPDRRTDAHANYAGRLRQARATVLPPGWVVYHAPARQPVRRSSP
ncbi:MAG: glycosyltransferase family 39 protein [Planctomycetes bacterium]|nr:glycosyltransferase family 39 protein [Planctomycetota bacterium]